MLLILLENAGQLVSRTELQRRLWGDGAFVELDNGLHVVAAKLREALGDRATNPLFIRTVSGRGYCFVGDATPVFDSNPDAPSSESNAIPGTTAAQVSDSGSDATIEPLSEPAPPVLSVEPEKSGVRHRKLPVVIWSMLAVAVLAVLSVSIYRYMHRPLIGDQDKIVVGGFTNSTGNADFDGMLSSAILLELQESPYLDLIPDQRFRSLVANPDWAPLKEELHACVVLGGQVLLRGKISGLAPRYRVLLTARKCTDGRLLTTQSADAESQSAILGALDIASDRMRRRLGESDDSLQKFNVPLTQASTASLSALKAFTLGEEKRAQGNKAESIAAYKFATDLDPQFALAYARLGILYTNMGQPSLSYEYYRKAFDLRTHASDRDRLYIVTHYYAYGTGEIRLAIEDYEMWRMLYPRDVVPVNNLALEYLTVGQTEKAVELARRAIQLDPHDQFPYATLARAYQETGDYKDLAALCNDPVRGKTSAVGLHTACFLAAFAQNDEGGMEDQLRWARTNPEESKFLDDLALNAMYRGKMSEARHLFLEAKRSALQNNFTESAAEIQLDEASVEADLGLVRQAREDALGALGLVPGSAYEQALAALVLARIGDIQLAELEARKANSQAPLNTILNSVVLASARAAIQLQKHDSDGAIQSLEVTRPFDFCEIMGLAPAYYRGLAYLDNKQPKQAAREFQKVVDHRLLDPNSLYIVLSQLELGRAFQLSGDQMNAEKAFHEAGKNWQEADPGFPPLVRLHLYQRELASQPIDSSGLHPIGH
jgi:tetratricopeptide (TPR) repeat protein/DNA-binding winged helix-turn-helix (wHTH) protein